MCGWKPGRAIRRLTDLIAGVDDGILIDGDGSFSIDQQRYNFQFGGDAFWEIKGGKKARHDLAGGLPGEDHGFLAGLRRHRGTALTGSSSALPTTAKASPSRSTR